MEILEIVGRVVLVVAEHRIDGDVGEQVVGGGEEVVGPLPVAVAVDDEVAGDEHEGDLVGGDPAEVIEDALVDDLVEDVRVAAALLHVAHRDKLEVRLRRWRRRPEARHLGGLAAGGDGVEVGGVGEESVDQHVVHGPARGGRSGRS